MLAPTLIYWPVLRVLAGDTPFDTGPIVSAYVGALAADRVKTTSGVVEGTGGSDLAGQHLHAGRLLGHLLELLGQLGHLAPAWIGRAPTLATPSVGFNATLHLRAVTDGKFIAS
jgi:hypothetical protein